LALTDEVHLTDAGDERDVVLNQAKKGTPSSERTTANIWDYVNAIEQSVFMWNMFPYHPHEHGDPVTNRGRTGGKRNISQPLNQCEGR
jgi:hypothetical protein